MKMGQGQAGCLYWGANRLPLLGDKQEALIGVQTVNPYWGTKSLTLIGEKKK